MVYSSQDSQVVLSLLRQKVMSLKVWELSLLQFFNNLQLNHEYTKMNNIIVEYANSLDPDEAAQNEPSHLF